MRRIYKYVLDPDTPLQLDLCDPQTVLVAPDPITGDLTIWIEHAVDQGPSLSTRYVVVGTGWEFHEGMSHEGSVVCRSYVWHVYSVAS